MISKTRVAISMPAYNEEEGLIEFIEEISDSLPQYALKFFIVDDFSSDETYSSVISFASSSPDSPPIDIQKNLQNLGHGPSFIAAAKNACADEFDYLITTDGDGQFYGGDFARMLSLASAEGVGIVEGVRTGREDPLFRKFTSLLTRLLVFLKSGKFPKDANTPLRIYRRDMARVVFERISEREKTPNLLISIICRKENFDLNYMNVKSRVRRGENPTGTMWKTKIKILPSLRFLKFCYSAFLGYLRY